MSTWNLMYQGGTAIVRLHDDHGLVGDADQLLHAVLSCLEDPTVDQIELSCDESCHPGTELRALLAALEHGMGFTEKRIRCSALAEAMTGSRS